jgi:hypothetical protein
LSVFLRSSIKESSERRSKLSHQASEAQSPTFEQGVKSGELEQDDLYSTLEPNDILDLPRVGFAKERLNDCYLSLTDRNYGSNTSTHV